ncbi:hypothetical protein CRH09_24045 [Nocardia terpenica]|uniref:Uncharacterized protein n=2 Tax=Nocardia terpenica TaxID=455432 RepID=A0A291RNP4_9NOCA|nr:hypothetical protein CRH09_24045 [Nocardia terpenica]
MAVAAVTVALELSATTVAAAAPIASPVRGATNIVGTGSAGKVTGSAGRSTGSARAGTGSAKSLRPALPRPPAPAQPHPPANGHPLPHYQAPPEPERSWLLWEFIPDLMLMIPQLAPLLTDLLPPPPDQSPDPDQPPTDAPAAR